MFRKNVTDKFMENLKNIYKMLNDILYEYDKTSRFTIVDEKKDDCRNYYDKRLQCHNSGGLPSFENRPAGGGVGGIVLFLSFIKIPDCLTRQNVVILK